MSAPPKPWEKPGVNSQNAGLFTGDNMSSPAAPMTSIPGISGATTSVPSRSTAPPPIPERPTQQSAYGGGMGGYGGYGGYGSYGTGGYGSGLYGGGGGMYGGGMYGGGGGMYGSYGGYGQNRFGQYGQDPTQSNFARQAEESSRQAFQSIESIVQAFGSVSMMLESTFYAVSNSFRAVIGVADQFSRMKSHFAQIFSALAVVRTLRWLVRKLLVLLRLRAAGLPEDAWHQAAEEGARALLTETDIKGKRSSWPIMLFFAAVFGGPWLLWKLLSSLTSKKEKPEQWTDGTGDHYLGLAEHDFLGQQEDELTVRSGQTVFIAPKEMQPRMRGWLLASVNGEKQGIVPANYVKILGKRQGQRALPAPLPAPALPAPALPAPALPAPLPTAPQPPAPQMDAVFAQTVNDPANRMGSSGSLDMNKPAGEILDNVDWPNGN